MFEKMKINATSFTVSMNNVSTENHIFNTIEKSKRRQIFPDDIEIEDSFQEASQELTIIQSKRIIRHSKKINL